MYFTQVHEDAIVEYVATDSIERRTELYVQYIGPAFDEMVDKIVFTFKFTTLPNIDHLRAECKIWLITILDKYDHTKGWKAFSYFSVITKNWFIAQTKKRARKRRTEVEFSEMSKDAELRFLSVENTYNKEREIREFIESLKNEMEFWSLDDMNEKEEKVLKAVQTLIEEADNIDIFNKKAVYLYLRELTGMNTKQVVSGLKNMRKKYVLFKDDWNSGNI
jgi:hypothetical protein|tara:strand:- start:22 stop:681 length:660 start_codon:yes stop_codon:yes gene_type:complete